MKMLGVQMERDSLKKVKNGQGWRGSSKCKIWAVLASKCPLVLSQGDSSQEGNSEEATAA